MSEDILYEVAGDIGTITFNRPQARNAFTFAMYERVAEICDTVPTDGSLRVLIMTGAGDRAFAAGTDHRRRTVLRGSRRELAQALLLNFLDLLAHHAQPHHITAQLRARVLGQRRPFRGAKTVEPFLGLAQRRLKGADPEARQHCLHPVHEARTVADELFVLAARSLGVFVPDRRNRRHAAVALLAPQPTEEGAHQQLRVQTIGLCPSVLARDSDARGMDDIGLD